MDIKRQHEISQEVPYVHRNLEKNNKEKQTHNVERCLLVVESGDHTVILISHRYLTPSLQFSLLSRYQTLSITGEKIALILRRKAGPYIHLDSGCATNIPTFFIGPCPSFQVL